MMKKSFLLFISFFLTLSVFSQGIKFEEGSWKEILDLAKAQNKPVFVDIYTTWCGPCKKMSADIFPLKEVGDVYNQAFVCFKIDAEKGEGIVLAKKYDVKFYPTYLFINPDGSLIMKAIGSMPASDFIALTDKVKGELSDPKSIADWDKEYEQKKSDVAFVHSYLEKRGKLGLPNAQILDQYLSLLSKEDRTSEKIMEYYQIESREIKIQSIAYQNLTENSAELTSKYGRLIDALKASIIDNSFREACKMKDVSMLQLVIVENAKLPKSANPKSEEEFYMNYYRKINDQSNFIKYANLYGKNLMSVSKDSIQKMDKRAKSKLSQSLNQIAWNYFENVSDTKTLQNAVNWSKRSIEISPDNYSYLDTFANLLYKCGNKKKAIEQQTAAIEQAKKSGEDTKELEETLLKMQSGK